MLKSRVERHSSATPRRFKLDKTILLIGLWLLSFILAVITVLPSNLTADNFRLLWSIFLISAFIQLAFIVLVYLKLFKKTNDSKYSKKKKFQKNTSITIGFAILVLVWIMSAGRPAYFKMQDLINSDTVSQYRGECSIFTEFRYQGRRYRYLKALIKTPNLQPIRVSTELLKKINLYIYTEGEFACKTDVQITYLKYSLLVLDLYAL